MANNVTLGGDRLGSGKKMQVQLDDFQRSNHDLGYVWRSTMSPGTLVPFVNEVALPGDTFEINLNPKVLTHPTVGPLFGSYKLQCDIFSIPMRLYIPTLHNNPINIGLKMNTVKFPQVRINAPNIVKEYGHYNTQQVNPSSLIAYLGMRSFGHNPGRSDTFYKSWNAIPILSYFDIFKNFYANKQLDKAFIIHSKQENSRGFFNTYSYRAVNIVSSNLVNGSASVHDYNIIFPTTLKFSSTIKDQYLRFHGKFLYDKYISMDCNVVRGGTTINYEGGLEEFFDITYQDDTFIEYKLKYIPEIAGFDNSFTLKDLNFQTITNLDKLGIDLEEFDLANLDKMREKILQYTGVEPFNFGNGVNTVNISPYNLMFEEYYEGEAEEKIPRLLSCSQNQEGLLVKCYQNDLYNNWLKQETFVGIGSIEELTRIDTSDGYFTLDQLRLSNKVNMMLNRIAVSGGSYNDAIDAVWNISARLNSEIPKFEGGCFQEIIFSEVVNNSGTKEQPLGSLAGRGHNNTQQNGGHIVIHVNEPSYIMGIVSITPRIDYCQGNKWDVNLETLDDLHKPQLDQIGFQDQLTENMAGVTTVVDASINEFKAVGKVPAWINYMSNVNQVYGNFALEDNEMYMVMPR